MNELKMGFKQTMMQRLQHYEMYPMKAMPQGNSTPPSGMTTPPNMPTPQQRAPATAGGQVTDFSIQRILSEPKPTKGLRKSPPRLTATPKTPPSPFILDLSKSAPARHSPEAATLSASNGPVNSLGYPANYYGLHQDFLAMAAAANATKFYAQFFPHIFPAYNQPPATYSPPKRYFAPYVINSNGSRPSVAPSAPGQHANLHVPSPLKIATTNELSPTVAVNGSPGKLPCPRADCVDCLDYYKQFNYKNQRFSSSSPLSACTTSSGYSSVKTKSSSSSATEILMNSSTISLTTVNSLNISAKSSELMAKSLTTEMAVGAKLNLNAEEISYKCRICDKVFGCSQTLQAHEKTHKSPRYECADCGKGFSQLRNYKYHLSVHRGTKEFAAECPECGKTFNDKGYLSSHMKIHRNKKEYECPYCPKSFNQRVAFNMHVRIHTGVKPHKCTECGKRFSRKMLLKQHMRTHSGEKPYQCSVCGKSFADRSNMTLHHRLHSGIKPFSCPICPKAFTKKHHLKTHLNYHTGCKPYVCPHPNCNQAFTQSSNMRTHAKKCQFRPLHLQFPVVSSSACPMTNTMSAMPPPPPQQPVTATVDLTRMSSESPGIRMLTAHSAAASVLARTATTYSTTTPTVFPATVATTASMPQGLLAMRPFTL